jgi:hypothetical protein
MKLSSALKAILLLPILSLLSVASPGSAQNGSSVSIPTELKVPEGQKLVLKVQAIGEQLYVCTQATEPAAQGQWTWTLREPAALLRSDEGRVVGYHIKGPTWTLNDGSQIAGEVQQKVSSPDGAIPWLLLKVKSHTGDGLMSKVNWIQRLETVEGTAPESCSEAYRQTTLKVPYSAIYEFWGET